MRSCARPAKPAPRPDLPAMNSGAASNPFQQQVIKARHDLRNPLAHILGFSEMLADHARKQGHDALRADSLAINGLAEQILAQVNRALDLATVETRRGEFPQLQEHVGTLARQILTLTDAASQRFGALKDDVITNDLARIAGSARQLLDLADAVLPPLHLKQTNPPSDKN